MKTLRQEFSPRQTFIIRIASGLVLIVCGSVFVGQAVHHNVGPLAFIGSIGLVLVGFFNVLYGLAHRNGNREKWLP